jgi:hypothetical protein
VVSIALGGLPLISPATFRVSSSCAWVVVMVEVLS